MSRAEVPLQKLTGCVAAALTEKEIKTCGVFLTTGQNIAIDQAPGEAMAWVRLVNVTIAEGQGTEGSAGTTCSTAWRLDIEVGIALCWPLQEKPLTVDQHLSHQMAVDEAMSALYKAIACCPAWLREGPGEGRPANQRRLQVVRWQPIGPSGGIVGGAWLLNVEV